MVAKKDAGWMSLAEICQTEKLDINAVLALTGVPMYVQADAWLVEWGHHWNQKDPNDAGDGRWGDPYSEDLGPRFKSSGPAQPVSGRYRMEPPDSDEKKALARGEAVTVLGLLHVQHEKSDDWVVGQILLHPRPRITANDIWLDTVGQNVIFNELRPLPMTIQQPLTVVEARHIRQLLDGTHKRTAPELRAVLDVWLNEVAIKDTEVMAVDIGDRIRNRASQWDLGEVNDGRAKRMGLVGGQQSKKRKNKSANP